jgi:hypothetical protein
MARKTVSLLVFLLLFLLSSFSFSLLITMMSRKQSFGTGDAGVGPSPDSFFPFLCEMNHFSSRWPTLHSGIRAHIRWRVVVPNHARRHTMGPPLSRAANHGSPPLHRHAVVAGPATIVAGHCNARSYRACFENRLAGHGGGIHRTPGVRAKPRLNTHFRRVTQALHAPRYRLTCRDTQIWSGKSSLGNTRLDGFGAHLQILHCHRRHLGLLDHHRRCHLQEPLARLALP